MGRTKFEDEEGDIEENLEDPEEYGEDKANVIMGAIHDQLKDDWFNGTSEDEDDLEGILKYLEQKSYNELIDLDYEAYNKRKTVFKFCLMPLNVSLNFENEYVALNARHQLEYGGNASDVFNAV
ncbi:hypothetical protein Tco_0318207 [Tanacetum coccineum]